MRADSMEGWTCDRIWLILLRACLYRHRPHRALAELEGVIAILTIIKLPNLYDSLPTIVRKGGRVTDPLVLPHFNVKARFCCRFAAGVARVHAIHNCSLRIVRAKGGQPACRLDRPLAREYLTGMVAQIPR
jgi:hypothetical protein